MNLKNLRDQVRFKSNISDTTTLTNAQIDTHLNDAQDKMAVRIANVNEDFFEEQKSVFNLALNSGLYSLPTDLIKFKQLRLAYSTPSDDGDYKIATGYNPSNVLSVDRDETNVPSSNPIVDITNNYMRIRPVPDSAVTNGGQIYYIARPSGLSTTGDVSVIPKDYHDLMAVYAAGKVCEKFETWDKADRFTREFNASVASMLEDLGGRELNFPTRFRNPLEAGANKNVTELYG